MNVWRLWGDPLAVSLADAAFSHTGALADKVEKPWTAPPKGPSRAALYCPPARWRMGRSVCVLMLICTERLKSTEYFPRPVYRRVP